MKSTEKFADSTLCVHHPQVSMEGFQSLAVPVYRASTIVFPDLESYRARGSRSPDGYAYGLGGTPTSRTLEAQLTILSGGVRSIVVPSGQAAISILMLTVLQQQDHVLLPDNVYPPAKQFAREVLASYGVEVSIYDPMNLESIADQIRPGRTKLIWMEAPGSTSMEVCDIPAIVLLARKNGILTGCDNTWATSLNCKPLELGVDVVAEALTKYAGGHSDLLMGSLSFADMRLYAQVRRHLDNVGIGISPDECALVLRGLETLAVRLAHVSRVALDLASLMQGREGIANVLHPAIETTPGHTFWKRDFRGGTGVFSVRLAADVQEANICRALQELNIFSIGASWGGTRSLVAPMSLDGLRTASAPHQGAMYLRFSIGLEAPGDLERELARMLSNLAPSQKRSSRSPT